MGSPVIFGPNNITTGLQNGFLMADGSLFKSNGAKNYVSYGTFENNATTGWSLGTVGTQTNGLPTGTPTFGSGANANLSISAVSSGKLANNYSLSLASSAATTVGNMLATQAYTIDIADQAKVLQVRFAYSMTVNNGGNFSGTSSNTLAWAVWDVTNSVWLTSAGNFNVVQSSGVGICSGTVQTGATTAQIRLCLYFPAATSGASTWLIDEVFCGPQISSMGPPMSDMVAYTPTITGFGTCTNVAFYSKRVGDSLEVEGYFTAGTPTAVQAQITCGYNGANANVTIDTTKVKAGGLVGGAGQSGSSTTYFGINVLAPASNQTYINIGAQTSTAGTLTAVNGNFFGASANLTVRFTVPIVGWSSNTVQSSDTDTRVIAFRATRATAQSIGNASATAIQFNSIKNDTAGAWDAVNYRYTVPVTGYYQVSGGMIIGAGTTTMELRADLYIDGSVAAIQQNFKSGTTSGNLGVVYNFLRLLNAGQTIQLRCYQANSGSGSQSLLGDDTGLGDITCLYIDRVSGPAVVQATETIAASYWVSANFAASTTVPINYDSKDYDTHNAVTTSATAWKFTAPVTGTYAISGSGYITASGAGAVVYKNGAAYKAAGAICPSGAQVGTVAASIRLNAGDYIDIRPTGSVTVAGGSLATFSTTNISIWLVK